MTDTLFEHQGRFANIRGIMSQLAKASFLGRWRLSFPEAIGNTIALLRFAAVALRGFDITHVFVWAASEPLRAPYWVALEIALSTNLPVTYCAPRLWTFRE